MCKKRCKQDCIVLIFLNANFFLINSSCFTWKRTFGENSSLEKKLSSFQTWIFFDSYSKWMSLKWPADISDSHILHVPSKLSLFNNRQKKHAQFRMDTTEQGFLFLSAMHGGNFFVKNYALECRGWHDGVCSFDFHFTHS